MVKIKLSRIGRKNNPSYRIVVSNAREKRETYFIDQIGWYSPVTKSFDIDQDRVKYWLSVGAQPTDTVHSLLLKNKVIESGNLRKKLYSDKPKKKSVERKEKKQK